MKLFFYLLVLFTSNAFSQHKLAMIVAIGQYPASSGLPPIAAVNDVKYIRSTLNKNGFDDINIKTLINEQATKALILQALTDMAVKAKKKDIIVLHFGCHGQQIRDQKTIELGKDEDDGYDEALLPYDAKSRYNPTGYRGENHLRDDDLYPKLMAIRQKIGPEGSLLVLLDACNSGTGTRSESVAGSRGEPIPFPDPENPIDSLVEVPGAKQGFFDNMADSFSNMVVISGSGPHQVNKQVLVNKEELGALSYSFYKAMSEIPPGSNYGLLFEKIKATIQSFIPDQLPMLEGNADQEIFSGRYTPKIERIYLKVGLKKPALPEDSVFTIEKGMMDNLAIGSACSIYKAGTSDKIADAVIRKVENFRSIGVANKLLKRNESYEIRQLEESFGGLSAGIKLKFEEPLNKSSLETQVKRLIHPYSFLALSDNADFQVAVRTVAGNKQAALTDRNDKLLWTAALNSADSLSLEDSKQLLTNIKKALRIKYLRTMPDGGNLTPFFSARLFPNKEYDTAKGVVLEPGDSYSLKLNNKSDSTLFFTVLDIYPDNHVEVLYPSKGKEAADYSVGKQATVIRRLTVSKGTPAGVEFLKIIVSLEPMDLRAVFQQTVRRDAMSSFQAMLDDVFNERDERKSTRGDVSSLKAEEIGIFTVHFTIKPE